MGDFDFIRERPDLMVSTSDETFTLWDADWDSRTDMNVSEAERLFDLLGEWLNAQ